jgi:hypothetical protein
MLSFMIQNHPYRPRTDFRRKFVRRFRFHGSYFSRVGASGNPGAVHIRPEPAKGETVNSDGATRKGVRERTVKRGCAGAKEERALRHQTANQG